MEILGYGTHGINMVKEVKISIDEFVSKRINVTLPDSVADELEDWANAQGRSLANLAAFLLEMALKEAKEKGGIPSQGGSAKQKKDRFAKGDTKQTDR
jgi:hypothetical protein